LHDHNRQVGRRLRYRLIGAFQRLASGRGEIKGSKRSWAVSSSTKHLLDIVNSIAFLTFGPLANDLGCMTCAIKRGPGHCHSSRRVQGTWRQQKRYHWKLWDIEYCTVEVEEGPRQWGGHRLCVFWSPCCLHSTSWFHPVLCLSQVSSHLLNLLAWILSPVP
jgi:hypothetical protein